MHKRRYSASIFMTVVYGRHFIVQSNEYLGTAKRFATFCRPGGCLVDVIPGLEKFSLYNMLSDWRQAADDIFKKDSAVYTYYFKRMKKEVEDGTAPHSWGKEFVRSNFSKHGIDGLGAAYCA